MANAINLDLDKRFNFNFKRRVTLAGKTYSVTFNDQLGKDLTNLQLEIDGVQRDVYSKEDAFNDDMTVDQRKDYVASTSGAVLSDMLAFLDSVFGKGEGKRIYDYFGRQSYVLLQVIKVLRETKEKLDGTATYNKQQEHLARKRQYTKKGPRRAIADAKPQE